MYAHSSSRPSAPWQTLQDHGNAVTRLAASFAEAFSSSHVAQLAGLIHDAGKARDSFQQYLKSANGLDDAQYDGSDHSHSGVGACWAKAHLKGMGIPVAYAVAGHHSGLPDWLGGDTPDGALSPRLSREAAILEEPSVRTWIQGHEAEWLRIPREPPWRPFLPGDLSFWIRMLYSCLVDADFLDTEAFMDAEKNMARAGWASLPALAARFFERMDAMQATAAATPVNSIRAEIRAACESAAELPPGLFSLTVPTGGGKTLSSTAFAFRHAPRHGLRRIIYVIPYTSIIEQTADTLRTFLGDDAVLEHHSNLMDDRTTQRASLAAENWDAPIVVTTAVQFFESLFAYKSSRCRKLHNIAGSVVILDEAQLLPAALLLPITDAIRQLCDHYHVSIVLSTATQPNLMEQPPLQGMHCREMIPVQLRLYERLRRTRIEFPAVDAPRKTWDEVAEELLQFPCVLCIVNTRRDCRELFEKMPEGTTHLSASMCGAHRSKIIGEIKERLKKGEFVRVISTQLVEAGVDVDFPVVYRAYTGLPSIAQSAGRCNREGRMDGLGRVVVFQPPKQAPNGDLRWSEQALTELRGEKPDRNLEAPDAFPDFFRLYYGQQHDMGTSVQSFLHGTEERQGHFQFREAAKTFRMIDDTLFVPVLVRYDGSETLIERLRLAGPHRDVLRPLQRYSVNVPRRAFGAMLSNGAVEEVGHDTGIYAQTMPSLYSEKFGLDYSDFQPDPEDFIC